MKPLYTASIPTVTDAGTHYMWCKVTGDGNHPDSISFDIINLQRLFYGGCAVFDCFLIQANNEHKSSGSSRDCITWSGNRYLHNSPSAIVGYDRQASAAHEFKPLLYVFQRDMGFAFVREAKAATVVLHDDLSAGIRVPLSDQGVQRPGIGVYAVL